MIYAGNELSVGPGFIAGATFTLQVGQVAQKLTIEVLDNDILLEVTDDERSAFSGGVDQLMLLRKGFNSRVFPSPITGWRFKTYKNAASARVTFTAYD